MEVADVFSADVKRFVSEKLGGDRREWRPHGEGRQAREAERGNLHGAFEQDQPGIVEQGVQGKG